MHGEGGWVAGGGGRRGAVDHQTVDVVEDNVYHCRGAVYDFETRVSSVRDREQDLGLGFQVSIRWCPFDRAAHGALKCVIDELLLVISVAVDVFLLAGGGFSDDHEYCEGCLHVVHLRITAGHWRRKTMVGNVEMIIEICLIASITHTVSDHLPGSHCSAHHQQPQQTTSNWSSNQTAKNGPCLTKPDIPLPLQANAKRASDFAPTQVTYIDGWLDKVTNEDVDYDYYHAIIDEYNYRGDHHHLSLPVTMPSGDEDSDSASDGDGGSSSGSTASARRRSLLSKTVYRNW
ncbi:hypothetical protein ACJ73_06588 [Blastomyces percursus]|uniref:Uncharacterized protein n=1 Tax=Blastomyces percursus TaxID=1658174 RepID=A0A1J9R240_9EURO|nr:hypothetical protein ACJ73_06588 [Blastomyces percursus]